MRKPALVLGLTLAMAVLSSPALADECEGGFHVWNNSRDYTLYVGYVGGGAALAVSAGTYAIVLGCWDVQIYPWNDPDGSPSVHSHDCPDPDNPVHRVGVSDNSPDVVAVIGTAPGQVFAHSCEPITW